MDEFELCYMLEAIRWESHFDEYKERRTTLMSHLTAEEALEELEYWFEYYRDSDTDNERTFYELPPYSKGWYKEDGAHEQGVRVTIKLMK